MKSYSTSTGGDNREREDLTEVPLEYRQIGGESDSESEVRYIFRNEHSVFQNNFQIQYYNTVSFSRDSLLKDLLI